MITERRHKYTLDEALQAMLEADDERRVITQIYPIRAQSTLKYYYYGWNRLQPFLAPDPFQ